MNGQKESFRKKEASEVLGLTPRTIAYYTEAGLLTPDVDNPKGKGTTRRYSRDNLYQLLLIKELARNGFRLDSIKSIMSHSQVRVTVSGEDESSRTILTIYDGQTEHGSAVFSASTDISKIKVNLKGLDRKKCYTTAFVIDLTGLEEIISKV